MLHGAIYSAFLHMAVVILTIFGLPYLRKEEPNFLEIPVELVTVAEMTNIATPPLKQAKPEAAKPLPEIKPPPKPPQLKTIPEARTPDTPVPEAEVPEAEVPETPPSLPRPSEAQTAELALPSQEKAAPPPPKARPEINSQPKPAVKAETPPPKDSFLTSVLNTLEKRRQQAPPVQDQPPDSREETDSPPPRINNNPDRPMTISELDAVRRQFIACWNVPVGAREAENLSVKIRLHVNMDGTVRESHLLEPMRMQGDSFYQAAAESALRAVRNPRCNPLKLPPEKYESWKIMTLNFDPKDMFRE